MSEHLKTTIASAVLIAFLIGSACVVITWYNDSRAQAIVEQSKQPPLEPTRNP